MITITTVINTGIEVNTVIHGNINPIINASGFTGNLLGLDPPITT